VSADWVEADPGKPLMMKASEERTLVDRLREAARMAAVEMSPDAALLEEAADALEGTLAHLASYLPAEADLFDRLDEVNARLRRMEPGPNTPLPCTVSGDIRGGVG